MSELSAAVIRLATVYAAKRAAMSLRLGLVETGTLSSKFILILRLDLLTLARHH